MVATPFQNLHWTGRETNERPADWQRVKGAERRKQRGIDQGTVKPG